MHHHATPRDMVKKQAKGGQQTLAEALQKATKSKEFSRDDALRAVAEFVVCDNQVSWMACSEPASSNDYQSLAVVNKTVFKNCLVSMRPNAVNADLPMTHEVTKVIHDQFIEFIDKLKQRVQVSNIYFSTYESDYLLVSITGSYHRASFDNNGPLVH